MNYENLRADQRPMSGDVLQAEIKAHPVNRDTQIFEFENNERQLRSSIVHFQVFCVCVCLCVYMCACVYVEHASCIVCVCVRACACMYVEQLSDVMCVRACVRACVRVCSFF